MNRNYLLRCDIEGVSGVVSYAQAEPGNAESDQGRRALAADLSACLEGLRAGGADALTIYDMHCAGRNVDVAALPEGVTLLAGKPVYTADWPGGLESGLAGLILVGLHSKSGTGELLHHSYEPELRDLRLNGRSVGEIGMEAALAGEFGVPLVLVTGDSAGCAEAEALVPGVRTVTVKDSLGPTSGRCYPLTETTAAIRQAAREVASKGVTAQPWRIEPPVELAIDLAESPLARRLRAACPHLMSAERTLRLTGPNVRTVWAEYQRLKVLA